MSTDSTPADPLLPRLLPIALGALIALALATAMLPPAPLEALATSDTLSTAPTTGDDTSVPDASSALRLHSDDPPSEAPATF